MTSIKKLSSTQRETIERLSAAIDDARRAGALGHLRNADYLDWQCVHEFFSAVHATNAAIERLTAREIAAEQKTQRVAP